MRILHTSDWHLGHTLYNQDRDEEQRDMLEQMAAIAADRKPDVFLVSGDIYHTSQPPAAVQHMLSDALVKIAGANSGMTVVMTAGNHDSGSRHEIFRTPWLAVNVHAIGTLDPDNPEKHIIEIPGKGYVIALPYCHERNMPERYVRKLLDMVKERNKDGLPVVMSAHTTVKGCDFTGHDNASEYSAGGIDCTDISSFGEGYDYLALGHIHHAQYVHTGRHNARYSGTPLPVSFDETYRHTVSLVDIPHHGATPTLEAIEISNPHPLVNLPAEGYASWEDALRLLSDFPPEIPAYLRLNVETADFLPPDARASALALTEGKRCRLCHINARRRKREDSGKETTLTVAEFQTEDPLEIAKRYAGDTGIDFDDDLCQLFREVARSVDNPS